MYMQESVLQQWTEYLQMCIIPALSNKIGHIVILLVRPSISYRM